MFEGMELSFDFFDCGAPGQRNARASLSYAMSRIREVLLSASMVRDPKEGEKLRSAYCIGEDMGEVRGILSLDSAGSAEIVSGTNSGRSGPDFLRLNPPGRF